MGRKVAMCFKRMGSPLSPSIEGRLCTVATATTKTASASGRHEPNHKHNLFGNKRDRPCETLRALAKRSDRGRAGAALVVVAQLQALVLQRRQLFSDQIQRTDYHFFRT